MNAEIERRKRNWLDFYDRNSNVNRLLVVEYTQDVISQPPLSWDKLPEREEWAYRRYMLQMENLDVIHDNAIPHLPVSTGTEIFAEAFGCPVKRSAGAMPFALPLIHDVSEFAKIKLPRLEDTKLTELFDLADRLKERAGKDALLRLPDMQTPMDVAALIWSKADFYMAMFDEENAVTDLAAMVKELMFAFLDEWFRRYGTDYIAHYPDFYMQGGITVSEDEIGVVNSDMFNRFFRGELCEFSERYGGIGIHCCADSNHQWQNLLSIPDLKVLNFVRDEENTRKAIEFFASSVPMYNNTMVDTDALPGGKSCHVANFQYTNSIENAVRIADEYNAKYGRN